MKLKSILGTLIGSFKSHAVSVSKPRDAAPLINIGQTMGKFSRLGDNFVADEGLPVSISMRDLCTQMIIFGETSSGMTSNLHFPRSHS